MKLLDNKGLEAALKIFKNINYVIGYLIRAYKRINRPIRFAEQKNNETERFFKMVYFHGQPLGAI